MSQVNMQNFSLPINPKLSEDFVVNTFIPFLLKYKNNIFDLYFTCRMPPFLQDAMGDTFTEDVRATTYNAIYISEQTGIPLSATFNNIHVVPNQQNLDIFIENFKPLYDMGVKIVTLPHTSWILTGQIQKQFPELYIKNTILREVAKANDIVSLAKAGFNYINLDRDLMRDQDQLRRLKEAKDYCASIGKPVKFSMLANEGCWGGCPIMPEHYHYNNTRQPNNPQYFNDSISRVSCSKWDEEDSATSFKAANLPPWRQDWEEMFGLGIDVFKMHGRESAMRLKESMDIIERWVNKEDLLFPQFNDYITDLSVKEKPIDIWREKIKTCKFDCWDCNYCDAVVSSHLRKQKYTENDLTKFVIDSIDKAARHESKYTGNSVSGLSSDKIKHLLNNLCSKNNSVYLELGCYSGSSFIAALQNNNCKGYAVDNFLDNVSPYRDDIEWDSVNAKEIFLTNQPQNSKLIEKNILNLTFGDIDSKTNIIFYDADHDARNQFDNLNNCLKFFEDRFVLIVDDANFSGVVDSVDEWVTHCKLKKIFERKILTSIIEDAESWWNGIYILILDK